MPMPKTAASLLPLLVGLCSIWPGTLFAQQTPAADKPLPTYLESGSGDLIRLQKGGVPSGAVHGSRLLPDGSETDLDEPGETRLVTVCLDNPHGMRRTKAFDINGTGSPRYPVRPGGQICAKLEPTRHTVYFWKSYGSGELFPTVSGKLDLTDANGTLITITWERE